MITKSLCLLGQVNEIRSLATIGINSIYKKYNYTDNFNPHSELSETTKQYAQQFTTKLNNIKRLKEMFVLDKSEINHEEINLDGIGDYIAFKTYIDEEGGDELLGGLSSVSNVIEHVSEPEEVKKAIKFMEGFDKLVRENTREDYTYANTIITTPTISL